MLPFAMRSLLAILLVFGCGDDASPVDGGPLPPGVDAGTTDAGPAADAGETPPVDTGPRGDAGPPPETLALSHPREFRGAWIATVFNINWPSRSGLDLAAQQRELRGLLDAAERSGLNAVVMQIRAECDAFYESELEPWSRFLTGTQGSDPGWDPLAFAIDEAHARNLELHAWMNPYRALASRSAATHSSHVMNTRPELVRAYGDFHWLDPGSPQALDHTLAVIRDVLTRYDIDGLHFDDYFYPYPGEGGEFDDAATYAAYQAEGGELGRADWRRENVHRMVRSVHEVVEELRPDVRFGISPFGIYRPGMPPGITGLDQYASLYADPLVWMEEGWLDYIAPQLYWPTTQTAQAYDRLLDWWADHAASTGRTLLAGNYLAQLGSSSAWNVGEIRQQVQLVRDARDRRAYGNILYHVEPLVEDRAGVATMLAEDFYEVPVATPPLVGATGTVPPPDPRAEGAEIVLTPNAALRSWLLYLEVDGAWELRARVPAQTARVEVWRGTWAVSALDRRSLESGAVVLEVSEGEPPTPDPDPPPTGDSCTHSFGGVYAHTACSPTYQCCDGSWRMRGGGSECGACLCQEDTGTVGCTEAD